MPDRRPTLRTTGQRGFTLMELLVVVVIIGILATFAVSRYINVKDKGLVAAATYDLDLTRKVLAYYSVDHSAFPAAISSYDDLKSQMVDLNGNPYGKMPISYTFTWVSYALDPNGDYVIRIMAPDHDRTVLVATPEAIWRE
jgi:prepilin-type N-terminal cleavage/methylation domain-containing protein